MPGLCGIVTPQDRRVDPERLARARAIHAIDGVRFYEQSYIADHALILNLLAEGAFDDGIPLDYAEDERAVLFVEGELFDLEDVRDRFRSNAKDVPELLLDVYRSAGEDGFIELNGEFNVVIYEKDAHTLRILTDHMASQPMYFMETDQGLLFGSEKKLLQGLADASFKLDPVGLLQMFAHVHNVGRRTFIEGVFRLEPGDRLRYSDGKVSIRTAESFDFSATTRGDTRDIAERWRTHLVNATDRRLHDGRGVQISLSAGLDSRAIACAIARSHRPIAARTWGVGESQEVRYASQIAASLDFDHFVEDPTRFRHSDALEAIVWRTDGEIQYRNGISIFSHQRMRSFGNSVAGGWLGSTAGGQLRPFMFKPMNREQFLESVFRWYCTDTPEQLGRVFQPSVVKACMPEVKEVFLRSYDRIQGCSNLMAQEYWNIFQRQRRMTVSSMSVDSHLFQKFRPFFDVDYLRFVMSIPTRYKIGQSVYQSVIYALGPEIRDVPNSNTDVSLFESASANFLSYVWSSRRNVYRKLAGKFGLNYQAKGLTPSLDLAAATRKDTTLKARIEDFVESDYCDGNLFNQAGIREILSEHYNNQTDHGRLISIIATYAVALRYFVYDFPETCPGEADPLQPWATEATPS